MVRALKNASLALFATLALGALLVAPANADPFFEATTAPDTISGTSEVTQTFTTEGGNLVCESSSFSGSYSSTTFSTLRLHPAYGSCKAFGFVSATVKTEECDFIVDPYFNLVVTAYATISIDCPAGQSIKVTASTCSMEYQDVAGNQGLSKLDMLDGAGALFFEPEVSAMTYKVTNDGFLFPFGGKVEKKDGKYTAFGEVELDAAKGDLNIEGE